MLCGSQVAVCNGSLPQIDHIQKTTIGHSSQAVFFTANEVNVES